MNLSKRTASLLLAAALGMTACGHDDDDDEVVVPDPDPEPVTTTYQVTITNGTAAQPLSPVAVMLTDDSRFWSVGEAASDALALLAEAGDNSAIIETDNVLGAESGTAPLAPGETETLTVSVDDEPAVWLTVATMLVNTNDGFTGITGYALEDLEVDQTVSFWVNVYDAGTETNSEAAGTIPGPADGGEGASEGREETDRVSLHAGTVTMDDGLETSVLTQEHRFDNPSFTISVTRVE